MQTILTCLALISGCGELKKTDRVINGPVAQNNIVINSDFTPYYDQFMNTIGKSPYNISIEYDTLVLPEVGVCYSYTNNINNYIKIDRTFWSTASENLKQNLIFHELGHCVLGLEHNTKLMNVQKESVPESIMYPDLFGDEWYYESFKDYYFEQLKVAGDSK